MRFNPILSCFSEEETLFPRRSMNCNLSTSINPEEESMSDRSRRQFIRTTGLGAAALTLTGISGSGCSRTHRSHGANVSISHA